MTKYRSFAGLGIYVLTWVMLWTLGVIRAPEIMLPIFVVGLLFFAALGIVGMRGSLQDPNGLYVRVLTGAAWIVLIGGAIFLAYTFLNSAA